MDFFHYVLHSMLHALGHQLNADAPQWLHIVLHTVLLGTPIALALILSLELGRRVYCLIRERRSVRNSFEVETSGLPPTAFSLILKHSRKAQVVLFITGLASMPILYGTLELPKLIINNALSEDFQAPRRILGELSQYQYLFVLSAAYLTLLIANGLIKLLVNVYKGKVGERLLRRLRLTIYRYWRRADREARDGDVIPLIAQEVEPIGGFAADAFSVPVLQGGTFLTIFLFIFVQDPILAAAAITLLPVQLAIIPRLQKRINEFSRQRVAELRRLAKKISEQSSHERIGSRRSKSAAIISSIAELERIRLGLHRVKFLTKFLNNLLTAMTPFFFYSVGGFLVLEGSLSLGALVAVLAAYKDFSTPLRELFRYYQSTEDIRIRYHDMLSYLSEIQHRAKSDTILEDTNSHKKGETSRRKTPVAEFS